MKFARHLLALVCALVAGVASAQGYPSKPVKLVIGFGPGTGSDILGRLLGTKLSEALGQAVVVENKPGAGGIIGSDSVAKAAPDGYTLLLGTNAMLITSPLLAKAPADRPAELVRVVDALAACEGRPQRGRSRVVWFAVGAAALATTGAIAFSARSSREAPPVSPPPEPAVSAPIVSTPPAPEPTAAPVDAAPAPADAKRAKPARVSPEAPENPYP